MGSIGGEFVSQPATHHLLLLAAGRGLRVGESVPKQYLTDRWGTTILQHTLRRATDAIDWDSIVVATPPDHVLSTRKLLASMGATSVTVVGGASDRMDSLRHALDAVPDVPDSVCVVHDGVRPLTPPVIFASVLTQIRENCYDASWPASPSRDTVLARMTNAQWEVAPTERVLIASTPIAVRRNILAQALERDSPVEGILIDRLIRMGVKWTTVENSLWNFKVTTSNDLEVARELLNSTQQF